MTKCLFARDGRYVGVLHLSLRHRRGPSRAPELALGLLDDCLAEAVAGNVTVGTSPGHGGTSRPTVLVVPYRPGGAITALAGVLPPDLRGAEVALADLVRRVVATRQLPATVLVPHAATLHELTLSRRGPNVVVVFGGGSAREGLSSRRAPGAGAAHPGPDEPGDRGPPSRQRSDGRHPRRAPPGQDGRAEPGRGRQSGSGLGAGADQLTEARTARSRADSIACEACPSRWRTSGSPSATSKRRSPSSPTSGSASSAATRSAGSGPTPPSASTATRPGSPCSRRQTATGASSCFEYIHPAAIETAPTRANEIGMHRVAFSVDDIDQALEIAARRLPPAARGGDLRRRLQARYVRGPSGIIVMLAQELR